MSKNYIDVTEKWLRESTPNSHRVEEQLYYEYNGVKYEVDGKKVVLDYSKKEMEVAEWLENTFGGEIKMMPRVIYPQKINTADYYFKNDYYALKCIYGITINTIDRAIKDCKNQSQNFVIDITNSEIDINDAIKYIKMIFESNYRCWVNIIILKSENILIKVFQRKNEANLKPNGSRLLHL